MLMRLLNLSIVKSPHQTSNIVIPSENPSYNSKKYPTGVFL